jgi:hypothetical protein
MLRSAIAKEQELLARIMPAPNLFGLNFKNSAPGFLFVFGGQPDIRHLASESGWMTKDPLLNTAFQSRYNQVLTLGFD